jgi:succinylglutamate desuccinylase
MKLKINRWIKQNCQNEPTNTKLEFYDLNKDVSKVVYVKDSYQGYLTDDLDDFDDFEWRALGSDLYLLGESVEIIIYNSPITNMILF